MRDPARLLAQGLREAMAGDGALIGSVDIPEGPRSEGTGSRAVFFCVMPVEKAIDRIPVSAGMTDVSGSDGKPAHYQGACSLDKVEK